MNGSAREASLIEPSDCPIGRRNVVEAFGKLLDPSGNRRILLVDGFSGTGKTFVIDWLRQFRCRSVPTAIVLLSPDCHETDLIRSIIFQLDLALAPKYDALIDESTVGERSRAFGQLSFSQSVQARWGGSISNVQQTFNINVGDLSERIELERHASRLDALSRVVGPLACRPCVIFFDDCEYLSHPVLRKFVLQKLIPRLESLGPGVRLYLSGQSVPTEAFSLSEYRYLQLSEFQPRETADMLREAGFPDTDLHRRVHLLTAGHPLLVAMWLEAAGERQNTSQVSFSLLPAESLDQASCARWIYDRILGRFDDPKLRDIAANLCLFEWFDFSLIRAVFGDALREEVFEQMVRRSFIKRIGTAYRCHDLIRQYLRPQRMERDPLRCANVHRAAEKALRTRLRTEEERKGTRFFASRLMITTAIIHSVSQVSPKRTHDFVWRELGLALHEWEREYLFGLARDLMSRIEMPELVILGQEISHFLEQLSVFRGDERCLRLLELTAESALKLNKPIAPDLYAMAARFATGPKAVVLAALACSLRACAENVVLWAISEANAGYSELAVEVLGSMHAGTADCALVRLAEADIVAAQGDTQKSARLLTDCLTAFPEAAAEALLRLARGSLDRNDLLTAAHQLDSLLKLDPTQPEAICRRVDLLFREGRFREGICLIQHLDRHMAGAIDAECRLKQVLTNTRIREEMLMDFRSHPQSTSPGIVLAAIDVLAEKGNVQEVDELAQQLACIWPESRYITEVKRAWARLSAVRDDEALNLLETLAKRIAPFPDLYLLLSVAYQRKGRSDEGRAALQQGMKQLHWARDLFAVHYADLLARDSPADAIRYLDHLNTEQATGPLCALKKAILLAASQPAKAVDMLERLVYTEDRGTLAEPALVSARISLGRLLVEVGRDKEAVKIVDSTIELFPTNQEAILGAIGILGRVADEDRLRALFTAFQHGSPRLAWESLAQLSRIIAERRRDVPTLLSELRDHPDRIEIFVAIEAIFSTSDQPEAVIDLWIKAEQLSPGSSTQLRIARQRMIADLPAAEFEAARSLMQSPLTPPLTVMVLADAIASTGRAKEIEEALVAVDRISEKLPSTFAQCIRAKILLYGGEPKQLDDAATLLHSYIDSDSIPPIPLIEPIDLLLQKRNDTEARLRLYRKISEAYPGLRCQALARIVAILQERHRPQEALDLIESESSDGNPGTGVHLQKPALLNKVERYVEAIECAQLIESAPQTPPLAKALAANMRGDSYFAQCKYEKAVKAYHDATEYYPMSISYLKISQTHESRGEFLKAYETLLDAVSVDPSLVLQQRTNLHRLYTQAQERAAPTA